MDTTDRIELEGSETPRARDAGIHPPVDQPTVTNEKKNKKKRLLSGPTLLLLGGAAVLTLAGAALSALAVSSDPTMRAEDSPYETTSKAVLVRRELERSRSRLFVADVGATESVVYVDRSQQLDRDL
jgi:hypothetical protein